MVFGGQITFSTPQKYFSAPKNIFRRFFFFLGPILCEMENADRKQKRRFSIWIFRSGIAFFSDRKIQIEKSRSKNAVFRFRSRIRSGLRLSEKPPFFVARNQKSAFSAGAEGAKSCILGSPAIRGSGGENFPSRFEGVSGVSWNPSGGSTKGFELRVHEASVMMSPRGRREDVAVPSRRRLPAETPRGLRAGAPLSLHGAVVKPF